jgi:ankyrin repeat protein
VTERSFLIGLTPLHWAAIRGDAGSASTRVAAGADTARFSWFLLSPGEMALLNNHRALGLTVGHLGLPSGRSSGREFQP